MSNPYLSSGIVVKMAPAPFLRLYSISFFSEWLVFLASSSAASFAASCLAFLAAVLILEIAAGSRSYFVSPSASFCLSIAVSLREFAKCVSPLLLWGPLYLALPPSVGVRILRACDQT